MTLRPPGTAPKIIAAAGILPPHHYTLEDVLPYARQWVQGHPPEFQTKVEKIFTNAQVNSRRTVLPIEQIFAPMTLDEKNSIYREHIVPLAEQAFRHALQKAHLNPADIDCLITTSCTGYMTPSLDAFLVNRLEMKPTTRRMPITEMGCIGGAAGLIYAENYLRAYPDRYVALVSAEITTITFQKEDFSWANIVSTAIFGDGAACVILGPSNKLAPQIVGSKMHHFPETIDKLGFDLTGTGFKMVLNEHLPDLLRSNFDAYTTPILKEYDWTLDEITHFMIHPGGKKILHNLGTLLQPLGKNLEDSKAVLAEYGNMSSATLLFILERFLNKPISPGEKGMILGFGPGLTASAMLLLWGEAGVS